MRGLRAYVILLTSCQRGVPNPCELKAAGECPRRAPSQTTRSFSQHARAAWRGINEILIDHHRCWCIVGDDFAEQGRRRPYADNGTRWDVSRQARSDTHRSRIPRPEICATPNGGATLEVAAARDAGIGYAGCDTPRQPLPTTRLAGFCQYF